MVIFPEFLLQIYSNANCTIWTHRPKFDQLVQVVQFMPVEVPLVLALIWAYRKDMELIFPWSLSMQITFPAGIMCPTVDLGYFTTGHAGISCYIILIRDFLIQIYVVSMDHEMYKNISFEYNKKFLFLLL